MAKEQPLPSMAVATGSVGIRALRAQVLAGISYRQLDYWTRMHYVEPSVASAHGSGSQRLYSDLDVLRLSLIKFLLDGGISLNRAVRASETLLDIQQDRLRDFLMLIYGDGDTVVVRPANLAQVMLDRSFAMATVVSLPGVIDQLLMRYLAYDQEAPQGWASE